MKKILTLGILSLFSIAMFTSCEDGFLTINLEEEQTVATFTIVSGTVGPYSHSGSSDKLDIDSILEANEINPDQLESVTIKSGKITVVDNTGGNFADMSELSFSITPANSPAIEVINNQDPGEGDVFEIPSEALDAVGNILVISENPFDYLIELTVDNELTADVPMKVDMTLNIEAKATDTE